MNNEVIMDESLKRVQILCLQDTLVQNILISVLQKEIAIYALVLNSEHRTNTLVILK